VAWGKKKKADGGEFLRRFPKKTRESSKTTILKKKLSVHLPAPITCKGGTGPEKGELLSLSQGASGGKSAEANNSLTSRGEKDIETKHARRKLEKEKVFTDKNVHYKKTYEKEQPHTSRHRKSRGKRTRCEFSKQPCGVHDNARSGKKLVRPKELKRGQIFGAERVGGGGGGEKLLGGSRFHNFYIAAGRRSQSAWKLSLEREDSLAGPFIQVSTKKNPKKRCANRSGRTDGEKKGQSLGISERLKLLERGRSAAQEN